MEREVVLDTETTGTGAEDRVIEIGMVEIINKIPTGRTFHQYFNPERAISKGATGVHGITDEFVAKKPRFKLHAAAIIRFINGDPIVAHNAPFDRRMLNAEYARLGLGEITSPWVDTLPMARKARPGGRHTLDALLSHYKIQGVNRELHGALLDAQLLAEVYPHLCGGLQHDLQLPGVRVEDIVEAREDRGYAGRVYRPRATPAELEAHAAFVALLGGKGTKPLWHELAEPALPAAA